MNKYLNTTDQINISRIGITMPLLLLGFFALATLGLLSFVIPIEYIVLGIALIGLGVTFFLKPTYAFYLAIFTIPLMKRFRDFPISFTINEIAILICFFAVLFNFLFRGQRVNLSTALDKYILVITVLFFVAGITSESSTGLLAAFKFSEAILIYYMTIYFIRSKQTRISEVLKLLLITAMAQACFGFIQSITGHSFTFNDTLYFSNRGLLGYFDIGSSFVWHGRGTMLHFNSLGYFLSLVLLTFLPLYHYVIKKKFWANAVIGILLMGILTTYSRGSLIAISAGGIFLLSQTMKNKKKFIILCVILAVLAGLLSLYLNSTDYGMTVNSRENIWNTVWASITSCDRYLWFGAGLNSYNVVVWPYFFQNEHPVFAHDFYLLCIQEMGILGAPIFLSFFVYLFINTWKRYTGASGYFRILNLLLIMALIEFFVNGIYDHSYVLPSFKVVLFLIIGMVYAKDKKVVSTSE